MAPKFKSIEHRRLDLSKLFEDTNAAIDKETQAQAQDAPTAPVALLTECEVIEIDFALRQRLIKYAA